ncbi:multidrug transporter [Myxococcus sp. K15C18031901]|uniref:S28 family serine protease n=1 Tax=Myxococcus dinghuensis TaxID=2906761 RepID=UPI0020A6FE76|nr:S28 family serine protease [Myxococcus dinghuensis]MCP3101838.1 multidrug transporter [Myxococcus dinghuensis]
MSPAPRVRGGWLARALLPLLLAGCGEDAAPKDEDLLTSLSSIPGLTVREEPVGAHLPEGSRFFVMEFDQPADHARPEGLRFRQRLTLLHVSSAAPMVLYTGGYFVSTEPSRREPTQLLGANQLSVEHRFFGPSRPEPADWDLLTIRQSADDFHRVVESFKPLYPGSWVSTGASKGGETMVFFRRFHPDDVDATLAYVAPIARWDDARFVDFLDTVGTPACRARLKAFQRAVLERRDTLRPLVDALVARQGLSFEHLGAERALEHAVIEHNFYFWQYDDASRCDALPDASATDAQLLEALDGLVGLSSFADADVDAYGPYYFQATLELGYPRPFEAHLGDLLRHPGTDVPQVYVPRGTAPVFRPEAMPDVQDWVSRQGERLMFVYGGNDPWSAAPYVLGGARDSFLFTVPGGNHGARVGLLPEPERTEALDILRRWMGGSTRASRLQSRDWRLEPEGEEFGPHPPRSGRR